MGFFFFREKFKSKILKYFKAFDRVSSHLQIGPKETFQKQGPPPRPMGAGGTQPLHKGPRKMAAAGTCLGILAHGALTHG